MLLGGLLPVATAEKNGLMPFFLFTNKKKRIGYVDGNTANRLTIEINYLSSVEIFKGLVGGITMQYCTVSTQNVWTGGYGRITIYPSGWGNCKITHDYGNGGKEAKISSSFSDGKYTVNIDFLSNTYYECNIVDGIEILTSLV